jgi:UrcA family protein
MTRFKTLVPLNLPLLFVLGTQLTIATSLARAAEAPKDDTPAKAVDYSDLNLRKNADVARLYGRIKLAASSVCSPVAGKDAQRAARFHHCVNDAVAQAVTQIDAPLLTQRYAAAATDEGIVSPPVSRLNR